MILKTKIIRYASWGLLLAYIIGVIFWVTSAPGMINCIGGDFICYYSASHKLLFGDILDVYNLKSLSVIETQITGHNYHTGWYYPPTFLLFVASFALFPYFVSWFFWLAVTTAGYIFVMRKITPHSCTAGLALAFPAAFQNFIFGQNGFLSAVLLGQGLLLLEEQPGLAGIFLGLLSYKPHLAVLSAIALIAARKWRALIATGATAAGLVAISIAIYGIASWEAFYRTIPIVRFFLENGIIPWNKMPTFFAMIRLWGGSIPLAYGLQAGFAILAVVVIAYMWFKRIFPLAYIALAIGIILVTPYAYLYDLTIAGIGIAWYCCEGMKNGWLPYEKAVLFLSWIIPVVDWPIVTKMQIVPVILLMLLIMVLRRHHVFAKAEAAEKIARPSVAKVPRFGVSHKTYA